MRYLAVIVALAIAIATAGLIQVLWLEFAFILDEELPGSSQVRDNPR
jgi:hypothetical protein